jgi:LysR family cys regulon transcriptional activator
MLLDARNIKGLADQFRQRDEGQLTIATTHTQARYALPKVVVEFKRLFPKVHLALHQGSPGEIASMLQLGEADIGVATEMLGGVAELTSFPFYAWRHTLIVPKGHPLASQTAPTLEAIAEYPLITYHEGFTGRERVDQAFASAGLSPDIIMSALDADVIKTYVALGLGVGIVASMAYDPQRDDHLQLIDTQQLFAQNVTQIAVRRGRYLRGYAYRFIELCSPGLTEAVVRTALAPPPTPDIDV